MAIFIFIAVTGSADNGVSAETLYTVATVPSSSTFTLCLGGGSSDFGLLTGFGFGIVLTAVIFGRARSSLPSER